MTFSDIAQKKVLGVPVLYLALGAVTILAVVAWRMKPAAEPTEEVEESVDDGGVSDAIVGTGKSPYDGLETNGTVIVSPTPAPSTEEANSTINDNNTWVSKGVQYLVSNNRATGGVALAALTKFTSGDNLSFAEGELRDAVIKEYGPPPDPLVQIGSTGTAPAQKQFTKYPGTHTVKGPNDNTMTKLASLYYSSTYSRNIDLIAAANLGINGRGDIPVGTKIYIPDLTTPKYYKATSSVRTMAAIASKNGISQQKLQALNPGMVFPAAVNAMVRVG